MAGRRRAIQQIVATPVVGPLLAYTVTLPLGLLLAEPGARGVFLPQAMPPGFVKNTATPLLLRPREFLANARDLVTLKAAVAEQAPRYAGIKAPITIISGDESDKTVSTKIHSRPLAEIAPNAKLIVLPGVGHMIQNAAPDLVISEIEAMVGRTTQRRRGDGRELAAAELSFSARKRRRTWAPVCFQRHGLRSGLPLSCAGKPCRLYPWP